MYKCINIFQAFYHSCRAGVLVISIGSSSLFLSYPFFFQDKSFEVPAGSLGFSVTIFTACAVVTVLIIMLRRYVSIFGGELGGPKVPKMICGMLLILIWIFYVVMSSLQAYEHISGF